MRILILDEWLPIPMDSGKRLRSYELLRRMARSHDLTWLSPQPDTPDMADQARGIMSSDGFCVETVRAPGRADRRRRIQVRRSRYLRADRARTNFAGHLGLRRRGR